MLLPIAGPVSAADERLASRLNRAAVEAIVADLPDALLDGVPPFATPDGHRAAYVTHLTRRLEEPRMWVEEAEGARHVSG